MRAFAERDWDTLRQLRHRDWTDHYPQSGETIVGTDNDRSLHEHYPGLPTIHVGRIEGSDPSYAVTPLFTLVRLSGAGDAWVGESLYEYPNGDIYHVVDLIELKAEHVYKETHYFAPRFEAPEWRAQWVQRT